MGPCSQCGAIRAKRRYMSSASAVLCFNREMCKKRQEKFYRLKHQPRLPGL